MLLLPQKASKCIRLCMHVSMNRRKLRIPKFKEKIDNANRAHEIQILPPSVPNTEISFKLYLLFPPGPYALTPY